MRAPDGGVAVDQRQQRVGIGGDVAHGEVLHHECVGQDCKSRRDERELHECSRARHGHPRADTALCSGERKDRLHRGDEERQDQRDLTEFGEHAVTAPARR